MIRLNKSKENNGRLDSGSERLLTECMRAAVEATMGIRLKLPTVRWSFGPETLVASSGPVFPTNSDDTFRADARLAELDEGCLALKLMDVRKDPDLIDPNGCAGTWVPTPIKELAVRDRLDGIQEQDPDLEELLSDAEALMAGLAASGRILRNGDALESLELAIRELCSASCAEAMHGRDIQHLELSYGRALHSVAVNDQGELEISSSDGRCGTFAESDTGLCLAALREALR